MVHFQSIVAPEKAEWIYRQLRGVDRREVDRMHKDPISGIANAISHSQQCLIATEGEKLISIWGVASASALSQIASPWCLTGDLVTEKKSLFARSSKLVVASWSRRFSMLSGYVDDEHEASKRWLGWLGFSLSDPFELGHAKSLFREFWMEC